VSVATFLSVTKVTVHLFNKIRFNWIESVHVCVCVCGRQGREGEKKTHADREMSSHRVENEGGEFLFLVPIAHHWLSSSSSPS